MNAFSGHTHDRDPSDQDAARRTADPRLHELVEDIEVLEEQLAILEEGLPRAPGMERAALAKEIAAYRRQLDAKQQALHQYGGGASTS